MNYSSAKDEKASANLNWYRYCIAEERFLAFGEDCPHTKQCSLIGKVFSESETYEM